MAGLDPALARRGQYVGAVVWARIVTQLACVGVAACGVTQSCAHLIV